MLRNTFRYQERIHNKKYIDHLFVNGKSLVVFPLRLVFLEKENKEVNLQTIAPIRVLISVPRKNFKRAVDRNRIKRMIREAYRKNKSILYDFLIKRNKQISLAIVYQSKEMADYKIIESKIILILQRFIKKYEKDNC